MKISRETDREPVDNMQITVRLIGLIALIHKILDSLSPDILIYKIIIYRCKISSHQSTFHLIRWLIKQTNHYYLLIVLIFLCSKPRPIICNNNISSLEIWLIISSSQGFSGLMVNQIFLLFSELFSYLRVCFIFICNIN